MEFSEFVALVAPSVLPSPYKSPYSEEQLRQIFKPFDRDRERTMNSCQTIIVVNHDRMSWHELKGRLDDFGYKEPKMMWYVLPNCSLGNGLREMNTYIEVGQMADLGVKFGHIDVYVEVDRKDDNAADEGGYDAYDEGDAGDQGGGDVHDDDVDGFTNWDEGGNDVMTMMKRMMIILSTIHLMTQIVLIRKST
ncbi:hypothetical protein CRG98_045331 [Punica granatum]|uniref:PB1-like domain-containing protein n=1 Tax=Punica granatum TaxID=22663 RepID=A0A2I0HS35_PUNGR|nr:hypothetical protein CRG98_045331 [Punica granatum]